MYFEFEGVLIFKTFYEEIFQAWSLENFLNVTKKIFLEDKLILKSKGVKMDQFLFKNVQIYTYDKNFILLKIWKGHRKYVYLMTS